MYLEKSFPVVTDGQFVVVAPGDLMPRFIGMRYAYRHHLLAVLAVGKEQCQAGIRMSLVARAGEAYRIGMVEIIRLFAEGAERRASSRISRMGRWGDPSPFML